MEECKTQSESELQSKTTMQNDKIKEVEAVIPHNHSRSVKCTTSTCASIENAIHTINSHVSVDVSVSDANKIQKSKSKVDGIDIDSIDEDDIEEYYRQNTKKCRFGSATDSIAKSQLNGDEGSVTDSENTSKKKAEDKANVSADRNINKRSKTKPNTKSEESVNMLETVPQNNQIQSRKQTADSKMETDSISQSQEERVQTVLTKIDNPLLMPEILEQIFDFMQRYQDERTMLSICRVSKLWNEIMQNRMSKFETTEILQCPPSPIGPTSPTCKKFYITLPLDNHEEFTSFCKTTGRQMKELNLSFKTCLEEADQVYPMNDTSIDSLFKCVNQFCPFVSTLNVWRNVLDIPPSDEYFACNYNSTKGKREPLVLPFKEIVNMFWNDSKGCDLLREIIVQSPFLHSLTFMHSSTSVMIEVLRILSHSPNKLNKLTSLRTIGMGITKEFINFVLGHEWKQLSFLDIEVNDEMVSTERVRALLNHLGSTLKTIKIKFMDLEFNVGPCVQESTWLLPASMKALKCVELVVPSLCATACSSFFVNVLQLPRVKSFKLSQTARNYVIGDDDELEEDLTHLNLFGILWNGQGNVLHRSDSKSEEKDNDKSASSSSLSLSLSLVSTIEKLNVSQTMTDPSLFQQIPNPLGNLVELKLQSVSVDVILAIFSSLVNLERLSFIADSFENVGEKMWDRKYWLNFSHLSGRILDWDEILTGNMKTDGSGARYKGVRPKCLMLPTSPSIRNLKKLKYLYIIPMDSEVFLTDFFIYFGAFHLKGLQHLVIRENYFTEEAIKDLRGELLPFCYLEVKCD